MSFHDDNSWIWDDICWCADSHECDRTDCFRHLSNRRKQPQPDICTMAMLKNTDACVMRQEQGHAPVD